MQDRPTDLKKSRVGPAELAAGTEWDWLDYFFTLFYPSSFRSPSLAEMA